MCATAAGFCCPFIYFFFTSQKFFINEFVYAGQINSQHTTKVDDPEIVVFFFIHIYDFTYSRRDAMRMVCVCVFASIFLSSKL